jgi:hypothetical protein
MAVTLNTHTCRITTAAGAVSNSNFDGTGSIIEAVPTHNNHPRVVREIRLTARSTTDGNTIRMYKYNHADAAWIPHSEYPVTPISAVSGTQRRWGLTLKPYDVILGKDDRLGFSAHTVGASPANEFYVHVEVEEVS